ncbi:MAG: nitrogen fixation protein NifH, partial [Chloroflexi bacterium]|nr:nitrogen fixation protein NifH [Chloroflexota bacterium]
FPHKPGGKVSEHWFRLGFPRSYHADLLQTALVLAALGYGKDPRLQSTIAFLMEKQLPGGGWALEETWNKLSVPFVKKSKVKPSKWITWQVLAILETIVD